MLSLAIVSALSLQRARFRRRTSRLSAQTEEAARVEIERRNADVETRFWDEGDVKRDVAVEATTSGELPTALLITERGVQTAEDVAAWLSREPAAAKTGRRVVVLGSGWGAASLVKALGETDKVTVISPRNHFLFTPMLAGAAVGTVEFRSITEPVRRLGKSVEYFEAMARRIDVGERRVECEAVVCEGTSCEITEFSVDYDVVVCSVGAATNTFGVKGVREHCLFLKQILDAAALRTAVGNCFERAALPGTTAEEAQRALSFVVVGAGPTGVEFCSELRDFLNSEASRFYRHLLPYARVTLLEATGTVLGAFDRSLREVALEELQKERVSDTAIVAPVDVRLGTAVSEVNQTHVHLGSPHLALPYGLCVWAAGNSPVRLVSESIDALGDIQTNAQPKCRGRLAVDSHLRVLGAPRGEVFAIGDCAAYPPQPLPATAQVAAQQGEYLARLLNADYELSKRVPERPAAHRTLAERLFCTTTSDGVVQARGFQFLDLGILTYVGDSKALAQVSIGDKGPTFKGAGRVAFGLWYVSLFAFVTLALARRSVYLAKQMSIRNRLLIAADWVRGRLFGRDISRF